MADWLGYETADEMNEAHDPLHAELCHWFMVPSFSLMTAQGIELASERKALAEMEEAAVLHVQRWLRHLHNAKEVVWETF